MKVIDSPQDFVASNFSLRLRKHNLEDYATKMATCVIVVKFIINAQSGRLCYKDGNLRYNRQHPFRYESVCNIRANVIRLKQPKFLLNVCQIGTDIKIT